MVRNTMTKLFADYEIKKIRMAEREVNERSVVCWATMLPWWIYSVRL